MNDPVLRRNVAKLADYGWVFELQVFSNQMADAARFVAALPEVQFVLVHSGMLESAGEADVEPWSDGMQRLAELPNLVTKLTGQGTFVHRVDPDLIRLVADACLEWFGADRCMWGSNFPVESLWTDYGSLMDAWQPGPLGPRRGGAGGGVRGDRGAGVPAVRRASQQTAEVVAGWLRDGRRVVAGTLVAVDGSSPLDVGASVYISEEGGLEGSVTGGCVEGAIAEEAFAMLARADGGAEPKLVTYGISDELAGTVGLMCGGIVHIFIHELRGDAARDATLLALEALLEERPAAIATLLDGPGAGSKLYVDADRRTGGLGGPELLDRNVEREARGLVVQGHSTVRTFGEDGATLGSGLRVHVAAFAQAPRMVIFGAIDFSAALAPLAKGIGYRVTIADPRRAFLASPRFSAFADTVAAWPDAVLEGVELGPRDAVLVFTHDPKLDVPAVQAALTTGAGYVGALGSRKTTDDRTARLRAAGVDDEALARVFAPCGLDIGASTVEETAVAVLAEIIAHRAGRDGGPLREAAGPIRRRRAETTA